MKLVFITIWWVTVWKLHFYILPQSSGDFDPEGDTVLKNSPDSSEISIRKLHISIQTKIISKSYIKKFLEMIPMIPLLIQDDIFIDPR